MHTVPDSISSLYVPCSAALHPARPAARSTTVMKAMGLRIIRFLSLTVVFDATMEKP